MELGDQDGEMGLPLPMLVGGYGAPPHIHESSKLKSLSGENNNGASSEENRPPDLLQQVKKAVKYRECLKNHAAGIGGHAIDGCGDFMPSGEDGTLEALKCAACGCHRNFHRREADGEPPFYYCYNPRKKRGLPGPAVPLLGAPPHGNHNNNNHFNNNHSNGAPLALPSNQAPNRLHPQMIMALGSGSLLSDCEGDNYMPAFGPPAFGCAPLAKKRFRTKFTNEQKEKMGAFAEKLGWKIQKHDEAAVQQFCVDIGVKRHILKVWMHNNKAHLVGKNTA